MSKNIFLKHLLCLTVALCVVLSLYIPSLASEPIWMKKISDEVWNDQGDETGLKKIYVSRFTIDKELVETTFEEKYGYSLKKYENEAIYKMTVIPEVTERVNAKYGSYYAKNEYLGNKAFDDKMTFLDHEILVDYNRHIAEKRSVSKQLYSQSNDLFVAKNQLVTNNIIYAGSYTGSFIMYADDETIEKIAKDETVESVSIWDNTIIFPLMSDQSVIRTDRTTGTKSIGYNNGNGYKGTDVKIGIIEMGKYDATNPHLYSIHNNKLIYVNNVRNDNTIVNAEDSGLTANEIKELNDHATFVTSTIVGQEINTGTNSFEGVVPNATVYQTSALDGDDIILAFETLADRGVTVINISLGGASGGYTNSLDKEIDKLCYLENITFVAAAGNYHPEDNPYNLVNSPATAYNAIAVGNANTNSNNPSYQISPSSSYVQFISENYELIYTNKPDLSAPGTLISWFDSNYVLQTYSGTSFSAPMVTGVVAQLHQAVPSLMSNPTKTKALILAGADPSIISNEDNPTVDDNNLVFIKSGLGMLNAVNSVNAALEGNYGSTTYNLRATSGNMQYYSGDAVQVGKQYLRAGEKVRVVLTFDKPETWLLVDENYNNNVDLFLYGPNGNLVSHSVTPVDSTGAPDVANNVEVLEFTAATAGEYIIKAKLITYNGAPGTTNLNVAVAWTTTHNHIYSDHYVQRPMYPAHYAYCICGKCIEENHTFISGPVGTYCQKCSYIYSYN